MYLVIFQRYQDYMRYEFIDKRSKISRKSA